MYICIEREIYVYIYIYIYTNIHISVTNTCVYIYIHIYIYIYIKWGRLAENLSSKTWDAPMTGASWISASTDNNTI